MDETEWYSCIHSAGYVCISTKVRNKTEYINECILFNSTSMILYTVCCLFLTKFELVASIKNWNISLNYLHCELWKIKFYQICVSVPKRIIHWMLPSLNRICNLYFLTLDPFFLTYLHYLPSLNNHFNLKIQYISKSNV